MKARYLIITFSIFTLIMACSNDRNMDDGEKYVNIHGRVKLEMDDVEPPESGFKTRFKTLEEWLTYICKNERPNKAIDTYNFGLFEGQNGYTLYLIGTNTYEISSDHTQIRTEFTPADMYFSLPESEYQGLKREQVYAHITSQLKEFIKTKNYENSLFQDAKYVKTEWNGEILANYEN